MNDFGGIPFPEIDPVAFSIFGFFDVRWYALAYLAGFLGGWGYGIWLSGRFAKAVPDWRPHRQDIEDMLPWLVGGVILGGRLGYVLFYNPAYYLAHPLHVFHLWEGGMSFHGGMAGVIAVLFFYARGQGISLLRLSDLVACAAPIGLFFGRIANFINGELFGRVTTAPWGVIFPYGGPFPRHPSQIYEAIGEGLLLFILLYVLARVAGYWKKPGLLSGVFLAGYGLARFCVEWVREPDPQLGLFAEYLTMGQILSLPMILGGVFLIHYASGRGEVLKNGSAEN
ncbi:MAG: prolipoprotein diacylglyceryl transferase [Micavibrio sp.]|nr:MAG: prolipoprotein diacylglyceryl transferase [Micavibrio sp.]